MRGFASDPMTVRAPRLAATRRLLASLCMVVALAMWASPIAGATLPDNRTDELVTRFVEGGQEVGLNGVLPSFQAASPSGEIVNWQGIGGCCGASSAAVNLYQSDRGGDGWQTRALTPMPSEPLEEIFNQQQPVFWNSDLSKTVISTPASYAAGDHRPKGTGTDDLYMETSTGALTWLSQGPSGNGSGPYTAKFEGATPDLGEVAFTSAEQLTPNAKGLSPLSPPAQYLYLRNVAEETTTLLDVGNNGELINSYGASLGDAGPAAESVFVPIFPGSVTHAISEDGTKVFFETPPEGVASLPEGVEPHLYMRDLANHTTTPLDDPNATGSAQYEGAAANGSLVFFTSDEGLNGASTAHELYEFNTTSAPIDSIAPMTAVAVAGGEGVLGVLAISNDGSHVFFVSDAVLANNVNSAKESALLNQPNLYGYDTTSGQTTFMATLAATDLSYCRSTCGEPGPERLLNPDDRFRPAVSTPDGSLLAFVSYGDFTNQDHAPATTLESKLEAGEHRIAVSSTAGFLPGQTISIDTGAKEEMQTIETIDNPTEMTFTEYSPAGINGLAEAHSPGAPIKVLNAQVYSYTTAGQTLNCISCTPAGVVPTGDAAFGEVGGGSYAPNDHAAPISEDGSRIFFESPDPLLPGMFAAESKAPIEWMNVYEWEGGKVSLIAEATQATELDGTTPSGNDVYFATRAPASAGEPGYQDIYDARVGGGFPPPPPQRPDPCLTESCRPLFAPTVFFPVPASTTVAEIGDGHPHDPASFLVENITASQRAALKRTGRMAVTAIATAAGRITLRASVRWHGRRRRVANVSATLAKAGKVTLALRLGRAMRAMIASGKVLTLQLEVSYSTNKGEKTAELVLGRTGAPTTRKPGHHG